MGNTDLSARIDDLFARPPSEGISLALVIQQGGQVIAERYGTQPPNELQPALQITADSTMISWSMAKSITHAAVGIAVSDGLVDVEAQAPVPEWADTPKESITMLDLLEMRSGLSFVEDYVDDSVSNCIEMLFGDSGPSHAAYAAALPLLHAPGTEWSYSSGTTNIITRVLGDVLIGASGGAPERRKEVMQTFLRDRLFGPVGMDSAQPKFDSAGDFVGSSYVYATARDFAQFGELYRHDGITDLGRGERILPEGWLDHARHKSAHDDSGGADYGRHWWMWPDLPGELHCSGHEGQYTCVIPDSELVLVHLGKTPAPVAAGLAARLRGMMQLF